MLESYYLISTIGVFQYLRTKPTALQLTLKDFPENTSFSSVNELYTDRRMEGTQEATNKSVHPFREYVVIEEFAKTM